MINRVRSALTISATLAFALTSFSAAPAATIQYLRNSSQAQVQLAFLATDGTVIGQGYQPNLWYRYTPDATGGYIDGTWTQIASLQAGYNPSAYSSAVLADGRLAIIGGEYNAGENNYQLQLTNLGAIYDPVKNKWTPLGHPTGWDYIGDSPNSVLPGGEFLVGNKLTEEAAFLDPSNLKWTKVRTNGKSDFNAEEGYTLLPDGSVLTADVKDAPNSERYFPSKGKWVTAGSTIVDLHSPSPYSQCIQYGPLKQDCYLPPGEIGPSILRPDGTVFYTGSYSQQGVGHTSIYNFMTNKWTVGPDFPNGDNAGDSFACLLPSGNVLVFGDSGYLYEFDGTKFTQTGSASGPPLLLPTGQVMMFNYSGGVSLYTPTGQPQASWAPVVTAVSTKIARGRTYKIQGMQFNGLSQAMSFGDEFQNATNYPLVRLTNLKSKHVFYARTHNHSTMGVATGKQLVSTLFDVPPKMDAGPSMLEVVANGIPSKAVAITVN